MLKEVKKRPFAALTFESSKSFILTYFQKIMWFYLLATKDSLLGKVWGKTFFPMRNALDCSYGDRHLIYQASWRSYIDCCIFVQDWPFMRSQSLYNRHQEVPSLNKKIIPISIVNKFPYLCHIKLESYVVKWVNGEVSTNNSLLNDSDADFCSQVKTTVTVFDNSPERFQ